MERSSCGPERFLCFKLSKVMRRVQRYYGKLSCFGVTPVQFYVLAAMREQDGWVPDFSPGARSIV